MESVQEANDAAAAFVAFDLLTNRQAQVMDQLAEGLSNKGIGNRLSISEATVKSYVQDLYQRTHCTNRIRLALYWLQYRGLIVVKPTLPIEDVGF